MSGPEAKRARVDPSHNSLPGTNASECEKEEKDTIPPFSWTDLPAELWATHILIFLPYADMIRSSIVSKTFLKEFAPRVTEIDVESPHEMKAAVAKRFRGVETLRIRCLFSHGGDLTDEDDEDSGPGPELGRKRARDPAPTRARARAAAAAAAPPAAGTRTAGKRRKKA